MSELSEYDGNHALSARFVLSAPLGFLVGLLCTKRELVANREDTLSLSCTLSEPSQSSTFL